MKLKNKENNQIFITDSESTIKTMLNSGKYEEIKESSNESTGKMKESENSNEDSKPKSNFQSRWINDR